MEKEIEIIRQGGIAIFPTDTAFGIGCRIDDEAAVKRLFAIKERSETQATPVLVSSVEMAHKYFRQVTPDINELMKRYWPGALTIVYPCRTDNVLDLVRGQGETVGLRMPNHVIPLEIIQTIGVPIIGTSANFHGQQTPYIFEDLDKDLRKKVDVVIPGECSVKEASTVIDCSVHPWKILRQGAVKLDI